MSEGVVFIATKDLTVQNEEEKPLSLRYVTGLRLFHRDLTGMMEINTLVSPIFSILLLLFLHVACIRTVILSLEITVLKVVGFNHKRGVGG